MKDLTGKRFGKLVAIERIKEKGSKWLCKCDCGKYTSVLTWNLVSGMTKSCGCGKGRPMRSTKCWECKNISFCEWSKGVPVPNWVAVPTIIKSRGGVCDRTSGKYYYKSLLLEYNMVHTIAKYYNIG